MEKMQGLMSILPGIDPAVDTMLKGWLHGSNARNPGVWDKASEDQFQQEISKTPWFQQFLAQYGEQPNLNDPQYDYRAAWSAGMRPQMYAGDNRYHWQSTTPDGLSLKGANHPTAWMEKFMQNYGVDPVTWRR